MILPEIVLHKAIISGMRAVRDDSRVLGHLFRQLTREQLAQVRELVTSKQLSIVTNYPKVDQKLPVIAINLRSEVESTTFLGDMLGESATHSYVVPEPLDTDSGGATVTSGPLPKALLTNIRVISYTNSGIVVSDRDADALVAAASGLSGANIHVVSGPGAGQVHPIKHITPPTIGISSPLLLPLTADSVIEVRELSNPILPETEGVQERMYRDDEPLYLKGALYDVTYDIAVFAANQEQVLYLYAVLKSILFSQRDYFEHNGIQGIRISGSDLGVFDTSSSDAFTRKLTITFTYEFSFLENVKIFDTIQINLSTPCSVFGGEISLDD